MKMLVRQQEKLEEHDRNFDRLDRKLDRLIDISLGKRTNGRRRV